MIPLTKVRKPALRMAGGAIYTHEVADFKLHIPPHLCPPYGLGSGYATHLMLGTVRLQLHHKTRTLSGAVPVTWLVDLNADSAVTMETIE